MHSTETVPSRQPTTDPSNYGQSSFDTRLNTYPSGYAHNQNTDRHGNHNNQDEYNQGHNYEGAFELPVSQWQNKEGHKYHDTSGGLFTRVPYPETSSGNQNHHHDLHHQTQHHHQQHSENDDYNSHEHPHRHHHKHEPHKNDHKHQPRKYENLI
jgi:hypothetical protein